MSKIDVRKCKHVAIDFCTKLYVCKNTEDYDYCANYENCYYKQLQQLKAENKKLEEKLKEVQKFLERHEVGGCDWDDDCCYCKNASKDGKYYCNIGNALEVIRSKK